MIDIPKQQQVDPRFDNLAGKLNEGIFRRNYGFLYDEYAPEEVDKLRAQLKREKSPKKKSKLTSMISQYSEQIKHHRIHKKFTEKLAEHNQKEKSAVAGGKAPYFLKVSSCSSGLFQELH